MMPESVPWIMVPFYIATLEQGKESFLNFQDDAYINSS